MNNVKINDLTKKFTNWSGNKKIDNFIQKMQLNNIDHSRRLDGINVFEWVSYGQFSDIKEVGKENLTTMTTIYSAVWKDGPLHYYNYHYHERKSYKQVSLKCLHNSQDITDEFLNEVW